MSNNESGANPMTDKLQEWQLKWIEDNTLFGCIDAELVRAFLAKFVLCDARPARWIKPELHGQADNAIATIDRTEICTMPLHAQATKEPE